MPLFRSCGIDKLSSRAIDEFMDGFKTAVVSAFRGIAYIDAVENRKNQSLSVMIVAHLRRRKQRKWGKRKQWKVFLYTIVNDYMNKVEFRYITFWTFTR